jgi:hypothetical protein
MLPPVGVYLNELLGRLLNTCIMRVLSTQISGKDSAAFTDRVTFCVLAYWVKVVATRSKIYLGEMGCRCKESSPASTCESIQKSPTNLYGRSISVKMSFNRLWVG